MIPNLTLRAKVEKTKDGAWLKVAKLTDVEQEELEEALDEPEPKLPALVEKSIVIYHE